MTDIVMHDIMLYSYPCEGGGNHENEVNREKQKKILHGACQLRRFEQERDHQSGKNRNGKVVVESRGDQFEEGRRDGGPEGDRGIKQELRHEKTRNKAGQAPLQRFVKDTYGAVFASDDGGNGIPHAKKDDGKNRNLFFQKTVHRSNRTGQSRSPC